MRHHETSVEHAPTSSAIVLEPEAQTRQREASRVINHYRYLVSDGGQVVNRTSAKDTTDGSYLTIHAGRQRRERERIEAGDRERERLGRELHDGLCQNLAGIAALGATLARKLAARNDPAQAAAAEITVLVQQAIGDARDLARGLSTGGVARMGLAAAMEALAANVEALHPVACAFAGDRHFPRLDPSVEAHLYRIAQEALSNAVAHGRGTRIGVSLRLRDREASLRIRDNGVGIPRGAGGVGGMGLDTMDYRARLIGARLQVRRAAPRGTLVACTFPLPALRAKERHHAGNPP